MHSRHALLAAVVLALVLPVGRARAKPSQDQLAGIWNLSRLATSNQDAAVERREAVIQLRGSRHDSGAPVTFGVPLPKDDIFRVDQMRVIDAQGNPVDCSITPTATWTQDGSLKWVLIDAAAPILSDDGGSDRPLNLWTLQYGRQVQAATVTSGVRVTQGDDAITVDTGALQAKFSRRRGSVIQSLQVDGRMVLDAAANPTAGLYFVDDRGRTFRSAADDPDYALEVEFHTPMRAVVKASGWYISEAGEKVCRYITRVYLYRGQLTLRVFTTWIVTVDTDTMQWRDLGLRLALPIGIGDVVRAGVDPRDVQAHQTLVLGRDPIWIAQVAARRGQVVVGAQSAWQGESIGNWVDMAGPRWGGLTVSSPDLAGHFPAGFGVDGRGLTLHAFTPQAGHTLGFRLEDLKARYGDEAWARFNSKLFKDPPYESRKSNGIGLAKTHEWVLTFRGPGQADDAGAVVSALDAALTPPLASATPQWNCRTGAFGPCFPQDFERFGDMERRVGDLLDQWIEVTRHMDPHYGFYDHGRGVPHHIEPDKLPDGRTRYIYSGYRRNYDLGYGNTVVPWLMYLRSGERRWLQVGIANTWHELDVRHVHPTGVDGTPRIGAKYWHYGSWSFDGSCLSLQDQWYKNLALCYYTTGYQRAMDVFGEIMESAYDAFLVGKTYELYDPSDRTGRVSIAGSVAVYYKATWDPRFRELHKALTPTVLDGQRQDGIFEVRTPWMEQFFQESLYDMPDPLPEVVASYERVTRSLIAVPTRSTEREFAPFALWWWHQRHQDPVVAAYAREQLGRYLDEKFNLIGPFGMRHLLYMPVWQMLTLVPGGESSLLPQSVQINHPGSRVIQVQHRQGAPSVAQLAYFGKAIVARDEQGAAQPSWITLDESILTYKLNVPADVATQRVTLHCEPAEFMLEKRNWRRLPWWPERDRLVFTWQGELPLVDTPLDPPAATWSLPEGEDPLLPSGRFGRGLRLGPQQRAQIDLGEASHDGHVRQAFDSRVGTIEFFIRFEGRTFGSLMTLPTEGVGHQPKKEYESAMWIAFSRYWDARMDNRNGRPQYFLYRQQPQFEPGRWHHIALVWDWNTRDGLNDPPGANPNKKQRHKILARYFLDGYAGPKIDGLGDDSMTYWLETADFLVPARVLRLGNAKPLSAVTIDELRISNVMRYPFGTLGEKAFDPPAESFKPDPQTLLLHHFEKAEDGVGSGGRRVPVQYIQPASATPDAAK